MPTKPDYSTSVVQLQATLLNMPPDTFVTSNDVGNLAVLNAQGVYIGYIDVRDDGCFHSYQIEGENVGS